MRRARAPLMGIIAGAALAGGASAQAPGAPVAVADNVLIQAESLSYDEITEEVVARGAVELIEGDRILRAQEVRYNQTTGVAIATGEVVLVEPDGEVVFADYVELEEALTRGFIRQARVLLQDDSRFAAADGLRTDGARTELRRAVYSPCEVCAEDPEADPLWQLKASRIVHDEGAQDVSYYHAFLEVFGIPVFYTPFFTHPDPSVERRSGFLAPSFGYDSRDGARIEIPYYYTFSPDFDVTTTPIIMTDEGVILQGEVRKRWRFGELTVAGSGGWLTYGREDGSETDRRMRGVIEIDGEFHIDENWRARVAAARASDTTYLRRFDFGSQAELESRLDVERFGERSYLRVGARSFQGLRADDDDEDSPHIAPDFEAETFADLGAAPGRLRLAARGFALERDNGPDSARASLEAGWRAGFIAPLGQEITLSANLRADGYLVGNYTPRGEEDRGRDGRLHPTAALDWRWPFVRYGETTTTYVEPMGTVILAPYGGQENRVPNEDSRGMAIDPSLLFEHQRFFGVDRVESGSRAAYGVRAGYTGEYGAIEGVIGQSFRWREDTGYESGSGFDSLFSDLVGAVTVSPSHHLDLGYSFRLDDDNFALLEQSASLSVGAPEFRVSGTYDFVRAESASIENANRHQIDLNLSSQFHERMRLSASWLRDIGDGRNLEYSVGLSYFDECFDALLELRRQNFRDRELEPNDTIFLRVSFKNLGEVVGDF